MTIVETLDITRYFIGFILHIVSGVASIFLANKIIMVPPDRLQLQKIFVTLAFFMFFMSTMPIFAFLHNYIIKSIFEDFIIATNTVYVFYVLKYLRK